jgi:adenylate cyclase
VSRILVLNHSPHLLALYQAVLSPRGYEVLTGEETSMSLSEIEAISPDLIILGNIQGIGNDELQLLYALRASPSTTRIPVIISTTAPQSAQLLSELNLFERILLLSKPFDYQRLLACVKQALCLVPP